MNFFAGFLTATCIFTFLQPSALISETIIYRTVEGELSTIEVNPESSFVDVITTLRSEAISEDAIPMSAERDSSNEVLLDFMVSSASSTNHQHLIPKSSGRQYHATLSPAEKKKITHSIETLGNSSLVAIARAKSTLEKEGKEIEHIHPLVFLAHIFSNEKLKAAIHNIHSRSWVWGKFFKGLKDGLEAEYNQNNLLEFLDDFSKRVNINVKKIYPLAEKQRWKDFIEALFIEIPRSENSGRYDM